MVFLISTTISQFKLHVTQTLVMVASTLFGANIFAQTHVGFLGVIHYMFESGRILARPNLADLSGLLNLQAEILNSVNSTILAMTLSLLMVVCFLTTKSKAERIARLSFLAIGCLGLMMVSDYLASTRGVYEVDFRYFAYAGWFGLISISCILCAILDLTKGSWLLVLVRCTGVLFGMALILFDLKGGVESRNENALFGRQIYIAPQCAPNLFKEAGIAPGSKRMASSACLGTAQFDQGASWTRGWRRGFPETFQEECPEKQHADDYSRRIIVPGMSSDQNSNSCG